MKKIIEFVKNIFFPDQSKPSWAYVAGEGRWVKKKRLSPLARIGIFIGGALALGGAGFYFFANTPQADAVLKNLTGPVTAGNDRVIFEIKLTPENDVIDNPALSALNINQSNADLTDKENLMPQIETAEFIPPVNSVNSNVENLSVERSRTVANNNILPRISNTPRRANINNIPESLRDYWIKIDKGNYTLSLYRGDEVVKIYNVAVGRNPGDKRRKGDHRTPVGDFYVTSIEDSSKWKHDFGDGKGKIAGAYGPWFIRLDAGGWKGIGIHGTHDPDSLGTMASEGCIRMANSELKELKNYAYRSMRVVIEE